jgi:hypothetical protein
VVGKTSISQKLLGEKPNEAMPVTEEGDKETEPPPPDVEVKQGNKDNPGKAKTAGNKNEETVVECDFCEKTFSSATQLSGK